MLSIIYEDNHVLGVVKPAGVLSQGDVTGDQDLLSALKAFVKERDHKPGNVFMGLVHRLDRPVGGAMVFAKTSKAASRMSAEFRERRVKKVYHAIVEGAPPKALDTLVHWLIRDSERRRTRVVRSEGKRAQLTYRVLNSGRECSLMEVDLQTGLPHQIRVQLAAERCPVVGDLKYGAKKTSLPAGVIALYCHSLEIKHPVQNRMITLTADPEPWWPEL